MPLGFLEARFLGLAWVGGGTASASDSVMLAWWVIFSKRVIVPSTYRIAVIHSFGFG